VGSLLAPSTKRVVPSLFVIMSGGVGRRAILGRFFGGKRPENIPLSVRRKKRWCIPVNEKKKEKD